MKSCMSKFSDKFAPMLKPLLSGVTGDTPVMNTWFMRPAYAPSSMVLKNLRATPLHLTML